MADMALQVVVAPLLGVILDNLSSPIVNQFGLLCGVSEELEKLSSTLSTIRLVLQDAGMAQITDATTKDWLRKLKEAAYEADDIIDECNIQVRNSFLSRFDLKHLKLRRKIAKRIRSVNAKFDVIASERDKFHLRGRTLECAVHEFKQEHESKNERETSSGLCEDVVYGRDGNKRDIISLLLSNANSENNLQVYPIIGIGGLGKTTLAQIIYNDESIVDTFDARIWVCVSEDFGVRRVTQMIISSIAGQECQLKDLDPLQNHLKQLLNGKKFLLVLDDVWNENPEMWDRLRSSLRCGANGSSIIVTTRQAVVAKLMGTHPSYHLTHLSDEDCWALFKGRAFGMEGKVVESLEAIGKQIVQKCGGVPLAAKSLGSSLRFEHDLSKWQSVKDSEIWELEQEEGGILPSLRLSYDRLSSSLRQCFVYCCLFPKDYEIEIEELMQLWMANGFVQSRGKMSLEAVASQMYKQLVSRSFLEDVDKENWYEKKICKMHDLMHDLACSVGRTECVVLEGADQIAAIPNSVRHILIPKEAEWIPSDILGKLSKSNPLLRTCLLHSEHGNPIKTVFRNLTCLRALDFKNSNIFLVNESLRKLKHLRYLNLSNHYVMKHLPECISTLKNLQTLKLRHCVELQALPRYLCKLISLRHLDLSCCVSLVELPKGIGELINLRHLNIDNCHSLIQMPVGMGRLILLETLRKFVIGAEESGGKVSEMHGLNCLGGELEITGLNHVRDGTEAKQANLAAKQNLSSLSLCWQGISTSINSEDVIEGLQPQESLIVLKIIGYSGSGFPSWIKLLVNLVDITLYSCDKCEKLPPLGHLPCLKKLRIKNMDSLKGINKEFYGISNGGTTGEGFFPSLEELAFSDMSKWEEWQALGNEQVFPCLKKMKLDRCPNLPLLPYSIQHSVENLEITSCEKLMVISLSCLRVLDINGSTDSLTSSSVGSLQNLPALQSLRISYPKLANITEKLENLSSLRSLNVTNCLALESISHSLRNLCSLEILSFQFCDQLDFTTGDFQHLTSLQTLKLWALPTLTSFPDLQHLHTLHVFVALDCPNLCVVPQWVQNLTSLHTLKMSYCHPDLRLRCKKDDGEYWPYISHIPHLDLSDTI